MKNPYAGVGRPVSGADFVGREDISRTIFESLVNSGCVSLSGLGRMGKTSLARNVFARIAIEAPGIRTGCVNMNEFRSQSDLWREILAEMLPDSSVGEGWPSDDSAAYLRFRRSLRNERNNGEGKLLLLLDEFDAVSDYDKAALIIDRIREIACDHNKYGLSFLFVSRRSLKRIQTECSGSNLFGICDNQTLIPFSRKELQTLCELSLPVSTDALEKLFHLTGGVPYLCASLLNKMIQVSSPSIIDEETVKSIVPGVTPDIYSYYDQLQSFLEEGNLWKAMCREFVAPKVEESSRRDMVELIRYGLVTDQTECGCLSDSLYDYINDSFHHLSMWEPLANFERALRLVVKKTLVSLYGNNWVKEAPQKKRYYSRLFPKLDELRIKEQSIFRIGSEDDLLEYSYPGTLKDIVTTEWDSFSALFGMTKAVFAEHMDAICILRNPTNHYRRAELVPSSVKLRAEEAIDALSSPLFQTQD